MNMFPSLLDFAVESSLNLGKDMISMMGVENLEEMEAEIELTDTEEMKQNLTGIGPYFLGIIGSLLFPGILYIIITALISKKKDSTPNTPELDNA